MTDVVSYLIAAASSFAVLFSVPLSVSAVFRMLALAPQVPSPPTGLPSFVSEAKFAAAWSFLVFIPASVLASAAGDTGLMFATSAGAVSVAAFARALFRSPQVADGPGWRTLWAALETALVVVGFLVFSFIRELVGPAGGAPD